MSLRRLRWRSSRVRERNRLNEMGSTWEIGVDALDLLRVIDVDDLLGVALDETVDEQSHKGSSHDQEEYQTEDIGATSILILHNDVMLAH